MERKKGVSIVLLLLIIICATVSGLLKDVENKDSDELTYPEGTLSDSLFVSQNNMYTPSEALPVRYEFKDVPYYCDTVSSMSAEVGEGTLYSVKEGLYIYLSEAEKEENMEETMLEEFSPALMLQYDPAYTYSEDMTAQEGYINGLAAEYVFHTFSVSDGKAVKTAYAATYALRSAGAEMDHTMIVSAVTTERSSEAFQEIKVLADSIVGTLRYDEKLEERQKKSRKETKELMPEESDEVKEKQPGTAEQAEAQKYIEDEDIDAKIIPIDVQEQYTNMKVTVRCTNVFPGAVYTLYTPSGNPITHYEDAGGGRIIFEAGENAIGRYVLKVTYFSEVGGLAIQVSEGITEETKEE